MKRNGIPLLPVTRYVTAWPPATAVSGADAATMKNTRSGTPRARRCSWAPPSPVPRAGAAAVSVAIGLSSSCVRQRTRLRCISTPVHDELREHPRAVGHRRQRDTLVDAVDLLAAGAEAHGRDPRADEVAGVRRGRRGQQR